MDFCKIGFFTAESLNIKWNQFSIVRDKNGVFFSVQILPDELAFSESLIIKSKFKIPSIDFIKKRLFAELKDGSYISIINENEISNATTVTVTILNQKVDGYLWNYREKHISNWL